MYETNTKMSCNKTYGSLSCLIIGLLIIIFVIAPYYELHFDENQYKIMGISIVVCICLCLCLSLIIGFVNRCVLPVVVIDNKPTFLPIYHANTVDTKKETECRVCRTKYDDTGNCIDCRYRNFSI